MSRLSKKTIERCKNKNDKQIKYILLTEKFEEEIEQELRKLPSDILSRFDYYKNCSRCIPKVKNIIEKGMKIEKEIIKLENYFRNIGENEKFTFPEKYLRYKERFFPGTKDILLYDRVKSIKKEIDEMF